MKVWIVWACNGENYEDNFNGIWAVCSSEEAAKQCIANVREQIRRDEERKDELLNIEDTRALTQDENTELNRICEREYYIPWSVEDDGVPYLEIREYEVMN